MRATCWAARPRRKCASRSRGTASGWPDILGPQQFLRSDRPYAVIGMSTERILNISAYKFVVLDDLATLRERIAQYACNLGLKGTVLLAEEGINLFLAGPQDAVHAFVARLQADARFADVVPKESWSDQVPFRYLRVKIKPEIIRMNHPAVQPQ